MTSGEKLLEVRDLHVRYRSHAIVDGVDLEIAAGEAVGLAGESGCGKTTTALAMMKLLPPALEQSGSITLRPPGVEPINIGRRTERGMGLVRWRHISLVFQGAMNSLDPVQRVDDQIAEAIQLHERVASKAALGERIDELLTTVGITPGLGRRYAHQLSGGQRQRVMIALALACRPSLVIADEPTTALDVVMQAQVLQLLERLREQLGLALILISHDLGALAETCDRICVMYAGRVVEQGSVESVFGSPQHPYTKRLLDTLPVIGGDRALAAPIPGGPPDPGELPEGCRFAPRCPYAAERCDQDPPLREVAPGHGAACHYSPWSEWPEVKPATAETVRMTDSLLEARDVEVQFGSRGTVARALDGVSLDWRRGEILGVVGESGCGKSTLARTLLGLQPAVGGTVALDGAGVDGRQVRAELRRRVQMIFQDPYQTLNPRQRVRAIVSEPLVVQKVAGDERDDRVRRALTDVGLDPERFLDRYPHQLSGGQRQRAAIAAALVLEPEGLICDEPVSMLDASVRAQILAVLVELQKRRELALLFITHDLSLAWSLCDRLAVMYLGRVVEQGRATDVIEHPQHPYTQALVDAVPVPAAGGGGRRELLGGELPDATDVPTGCRFHPRCPRRFAPCDKIDPSLIAAGAPDQLAACLLHDPEHAGEAHG